MLRVVPFLFPLFLAYGCEGAQERLGAAREYVTDPNTRVVVERVIENPLSPGSLLEIGGLVLGLLIAVAGGKYAVKKGIVKLVNNNQPTPKE